MNSAQSHSSFFENVSSYFDQAVALTQHPAGLLEQIKACNSAYSCRFPLSTRRGVFFGLREACSAQEDMRRLGLLAR